MADSVEILITARDETSRVLDQARSRFASLAGDMQNVERSGGQAFDGLGRNLDRLAVSFTRTLDPALGGTLSRVSTLGRAVLGTTGTVGGLATAIGGTIVAGAAVGGLALNQYIGTLSRVAQEQQKTNQLLAEMDFGGLAGRAQGLTRQMGELQASFSTWQVVKNVTVGAMNDIGSALDRLLGKIPSDFVQRFGVDRAALELAQTARAQAGAAITQLVPAQLAQTETRSRILGFQTGGELAGLRAQEALAQRNIATFLSEMDRREQELSNELSARERAIVLEGQQRLAAAPPEARPAIEAEIRAQREGLGRTTAFEQLRRQRRLGAEQIGFALAAGEEDLSRVPPIAGTEADAALAERQRVADLAHLDILRQRAVILGEITPELNAQLILAEAELLKRQAGLTVAEEAAIDARAQVAILEEMAALDPLAGLTRGFAEAKQASREWGNEMLQVAREVDRTMSRTFSDGLFNLFTGRKGEDLARQFGEGLLRSMTDVVGRQLSGAVSGIFASALQGFRGFVPGGGGGGVDLLSLLGGGGGGGGLVVSPSGQPAGALVMTATGQLAQVAPSGAIIGAGGQTFGADQILGLFTQANTLSGTLGGPGVTLGGASGGYLGALGATPITSLGASGLAAIQTTLLGQQLGFYTASGGLTVAGGAGLELATAGVQGGAYGAGSAAGVGATAGATAGGIATGVLAGVALGFTIYGGLSQEATAQNIAINAISGAVSGAILGGVIGTIINPGLGTVIGAALGAIIGGAAAGGTTGIKAPKKISTSEKSRRIGEAAAGNLMGAITEATSLEDLVAIFNTRWAPHGEVQILTNYQGITYWAGDFDDPPGALATVELMIIPEFLDALEIQVGETGAPRRRQDMIDAFRRKRDEILETLSNIPFGILESDRAAGVTRRTYLPFQQLYGLEKGTQALFGSSEFYRRDLGGEDATVAFLFDRLREYSVRKDVDISREDFLFR